MKHLLIILFATISCTVNAQVGIGTSTPNASAALEINASNKGVLLPKVALQSSSDGVTVASPATGLLVYNSNATLSTGSGSGVGYYYNTGTAGAPVWTRLATGSITAAKYIGPATSASTVLLGDFEFRYSSNTTNGYLQIRSISGASISTNLMIVESWVATGYGVSSSDNTTITTTFANYGSSVGTTGEINTVYVNVPSKNEVYRITLNLFGGPVEMLLVEKF